jgi:hypothetical protein
MCSNFGMAKELIFRSSCTIPYNERCLEYMFQEITSIMHILTWREYFSMVGRGTVHMALFSACQKKK